MSAAPAALSLVPSDPVLKAAEEAVGRCLSDSDLRMVTKWRRVEKYPERWILQALQDMLQQGKRKLAYAGGILRNYREEGAPEEPRPTPRARPPSVIIEPFRESNERDGYQTFDDAIRGITA